MSDQDAPFHAHVYYTHETRVAAHALHGGLLSAVGAHGPLGPLFVGQMRDRKVRPYPEPQFELHFLRASLQRILPVFKMSGLTVLVHPLTNDDLADHTTLAQWIGSPLPLDLTTLDPPGRIRESPVLENPMCSAYAVVDARRDRKVMKMSNAQPTLG